MSGATKNVGALESLDSELSKIGYRVPDLGEKLRQVDSPTSRRSLGKGAIEGFGLSPLHPQSEVPEPGPRTKPMHEASRGDFDGTPLKGSDVYVPTPTEDTLATTVDSSRVPRRILVETSDSTGGVRAISKEEWNAAKEAASKSPDSSSESSQDGVENSREEEGREFTDWVNKNFTSDQIAD